jgi:nucleotide-binding universal stress UspA family protein
MTMHPQDTDRAHVVVGVDDSPQSQAAVRWAAAHAAMTGAELDIVHVWGLEPSDMYGPTGDLRDAVLPDLRKRLEDMVTDAIGPATGPAAWTLEIIQGPPGPTLVQRASDADLLVVGTGEHAGVRRLVSGSVSHHCLSHAHGPVVAVPALAQPAAETDARVPESVSGARPS